MDNRAGEMEVFVAAAELGSFSAAADELALTQGAISRQVMSLEEQLGVRLFERGARGVALTTEGRAYAKSIAAALGEIRSASLHIMTKTHGNTLNLAMLPTFGTRWLLPRIPDFVPSCEQCWRRSSRGGSRSGHSTGAPLAACPPTSRS